MWKLLFFRIDAGIFRGQAPPFEKEEEKAEKHADDGGEHHAAKLRLADLQGDTGDSNHENDCGKQEIPALRVIHFGFDQHTQTGGSDDTEEHHADAADHGYGDGADGTADLAEEGDEN